MDAEVYELYKDSGSFEELSRIFDYDVSDIAYDEYAVRFSETEFCKNSPGMEWVEDDIVMVLKIAPYKISPDIKKDPKEVESFEFHRELFKLMAEG